MSEAIKDDVGDEDLESDSQSDISDVETLARGLGSGEPLEQKYWLSRDLISLTLHSYHPECAMRTGIQSGSAQPAPREHFNQHPIRFCRVSHPFNILTVLGCSVH
jgi:hypothetical protein